MGVLIAFIAFFATFFGIMYVFFTTRSRERLSLIEKGADASLFDTGKENVRHLNWGKFTLKTGMFLIGIGIGIIAGSILDTLNIMQRGADYVSMIFLFGGLSLVLFYIIDRKSR
ncbi:MAG: DUF6249 domain-containing protein [Bacteroidales bacterium]